MVNYSNIINLLFFQAIIALLAFKNRVSILFSVMLILAFFAPFLSASIIPTDFFSDQHMYLDILLSYRGLDFSGFDFTSTTALGAFILYLVPTPFIVDTISVGIVNIFLCNLLFLYIYKLNDLPLEVKYLFLLYPSNILYASLCLRDQLICIFAIVSLIEAIKGNKLKSFIFYLPLITLKKQLFIFTLPLIILINFFDFKIKMSKVWLFFFTYLLLAMLLWDQLNFYREVMWNENRFHPLNYEVTHYEPPENYLLEIPRSLINFFFRSFEVNLGKVKFFLQLQFLEEFFLAFFLIKLTLANYFKNKNLALIWIFFLIFSAFCYGYVVNNMGTLARYRYQIILIYLLVSSYHVNVTARHNMKL
jgi:hypothetical protein